MCRYKKNLSYDIKTSICWGYAILPEEYSKSKKTSCTTNVLQQFNFEKKIQLTEQPDNTPKAINQRRKRTTPQSQTHRNTHLCPFPTHTHYTYPVSNLKKVTQRHSSCYPSARACAQGCVDTQLCVAASSSSPHPSTHGSRERDTSSRALFSLSFRAHSSTTCQEPRDPWLLRERARVREIASDNLFARPRARSFSLRREYEIAAEIVKGRPGVGGRRCV